MAIPSVRSEANGRILIQGEDDKVIDDPLNESTNPQNQSKNNGTVSKNGREVVLSKVSKAGENPDGTPDIKIVMIPSPKRNVEDH